MGIIEGATTLTNTATTALGNISAATGLTGAVSAVTGGIESIGSLFGANKNKTNPLHKYATYNYNIGFAAVNDAYVSDPEGTYLAGAPLEYICRSAGADPNNRVKTAYGKYEFYIDNLQIKSIIGLKNGNNTNVSFVTFDVIEPYSMGMFIQAMQTAAFKQGNDYNHRTIPYLLTIEFRGNKEVGIMSSVPNTKRYLALQLSDIAMSVDSNGSKYVVELFPYNQTALLDINNRFQTEMSAKGKTVQEVLQVGPRSLQTTINARLQELKRQKIVEVADEVIILFPKDTATAAIPTSDAATESDAGATVNPSASGGGSIYSKLGVTKGKNETYIQGAGDCNVIGSSKLGFGTTRKADSPAAEETDVYDSKNKVFDMSKVAAPFEDGDFRFSQDTSITNAIDQVILQSEYAVNELKKTNEKNGFKKFWRIDTRVYPKDGGIQKGTGRKAYLLVYVVVPYLVHSSKVNPPNTKAEGFDLLKQSCVREYNYIYSGKNVDIIKFNIALQNGFVQQFPSDGNQRSQDIKLAVQQGDDKPKKDNDQVQPIGEGDKPGEGIFASMLSWTAKKFSTSKWGGGGEKTPAILAAEAFYDAITYGQDLVNIDLEILGDPVYLVTAGMGNVSYSSDAPFAPDGSVNWQYKETNIFLSFRTPLDINQSTGLYNFGIPGSAPLLQYSGIYTLMECDSTFAAGKFTQKLTGWRNPGYEIKKVSPQKGLNTDTPPQVVVEQKAGPEDKTIGADQGP